MGVSRVGIHVLKSKTTIILKPSHAMTLMRCCTSRPQQLSLTTLSHGKYPLVSGQ